MQSSFYRELTSIKWEDYVSKCEGGIKRLNETAIEICHDYRISTSDSFSTDFIAGKLALFLLEKERLSGSANSMLNPVPQQGIEAYLLRSNYVKSVVSRIIKAGVISESQPVVDLFSFDIYRQRLTNMMESFPKNIFMHAIAVKSNPIRGILQEAKKFGFGAECASFSEVLHSLSLGFDPEKIIYDSPCKTEWELKEALRLGIYINLDNTQEIMKVQTLLKENKSLVRDKQIGLRINPMVGTGAIASTSTATHDSKFGLQWCNETQNKLLDIFRMNTWLQGVHAHVGSQGCSIQLLVSGIKKLIEFSQWLNSSLGKKQIQVIDIGGGLPTVYDGVNEAVDFQEFSDLLCSEVPALFSGEYNVITEYGRSIFVKPGITVSKVEAIKDWCDQQIAVVHVGSNQFLRTSYLPHQWPLCFSIFDFDGNPKLANFMYQDIAGPLCFSGDFLGKGVFLPKIEVGDYVVIHDTGGYSFSMYCKFNSIRASPIYAYETDNESLPNYQLYSLKSRESVEEALSFWGHSIPLFYRTV